MIRRIIAFALILLSVSAHAQINQHYLRYLLSAQPPPGAVPWSTLGVSPGNSAAANTAALNALPTNETIFCDTGSTSVINISGQWVWQSNLTLQLNNCPILTSFNFPGQGGEISQPNVGGNISQILNPISNVNVDGLNIANGAGITAASWSNTGGGQATFTTNGSLGIRVGGQFTVVGMTPTGYNGTFVALAGTSGSTLVGALAVNPGTATAFGAAENLTVSTGILSANWSSGGGGTVTFLTSANLGIAVGDEFVIKNMAPNAYNQTFTAITGTSGTTLVANLSPNPGTATALGIATNPGQAGNTFLLYVDHLTLTNFTVGNNSGLGNFRGADQEYGFCVVFNSPIAPGNPGFRHQGNTVNPTTVTAASWATGTVTFTTAASQSVGVGDQFYIGNMIPAAYNGFYTATAGTSGTTLKAALVSNPGTASVMGVASSLIPEVPTTSTSLYNGATKPLVNSKSASVWLHDCTMQTGDGVYQISQSDVGMWPNINAVYYEYQNSTGLSSGGPLILLSYADRSGASPFYTCVISWFIFDNINGSGESNAIDFLSGDASTGGIFNGTISNSVIDGTPDLTPSGSITMKTSGNNGPDNGVIQNVTLSNITVTNAFESNALFNGNLINVTLTNSSFGPPRLGTSGSITVRDSTGVTISNSTIYGLINSGIAIGPNDNPAVYATCVASGSPAAACQPTITGNTINGIQDKASGGVNSGILAVNADSGTITGNTVTQVFTAFTGTISGTTLTIPPGAGSEPNPGFPVLIGGVLTGGSVVAGTSIIKQLTTAPGEPPLYGGTYQVSQSQTLASTALTLISPSVKSRGITMTTNDGAGDPGTTNTTVTGNDFSALKNTNSGTPVIVCANGQGNTVNTNTVPVNQSGSCSSPPAGGTLDLSVGGTITIPPRLGP